ncbi:hypothetical protein D3C78_907780 [compost metagenome]
MLEQSGVRSALPLQLDVSRFAPSGESLLSNAKEVTKNACPTIRVRLRRTSLLPSSFQGHASKGRPWPYEALATSMSLNPLHDDSTRPPEGAGRCCLSGSGRRRVGYRFAQRQPTNSAPEASGRGSRPVRRPSGGAAQRGERHGCCESRDGPGTARARRPSEQRRSEGSLREAKTRMSGQAFWFLLGVCKRDSPEGAKRETSNCSGNPERAPDSPGLPIRPESSSPQLREEHSSCGRHPDWHPMANLWRTSAIIDCPRMPP